MYAFRATDPQVQAFLDQLTRERRLTLFLNDLLRAHLARQAEQPGSAPLVNGEVQSLSLLAEDLLRLYQMPESTARVLAASPALLNARKLYGALPPEEEVDEVLAPLLALLGHRLLEMARRFYEEHNASPPEAVATLFETGKR